MILPLALDGALKPNVSAMRFQPLNRALIAISSAAIVLTLAVVAAKPASWFEQAYPQGVLAAVDRVGAEQPGLRVFANEAYADWLLLRRPALRGRIAFDARFELTSQTQIERLVSVRRTVDGWKKVVAPYGLFVLQKSDERTLARALLAMPRTRLEYRGHGVIVISRESRA
jgi:hypothetical protein